MHDGCSLEGTIVHLAIDGNYAGRIIIADEIKDDAVEAIRNLKNLGIKQTVMLTGDNRAIAKTTAETLQIDSYQAELLPEDKVEAVESYLRKTGKNKKVVFVGDGINDTPVIARADIGIAMGAFGADAAIETADIVLMTDSPAKIVEAIEVGKKTYQIVWQNIILAMSIKGLFILLGIFGVATLWEAVFTDVGVALLAILNASRVLKS
ncbi:cadmium-translocating P-type ATPase [Calothrix parasitica NIES-267]|uniref:Cadmium-translocating P-type ATPase n=1 Tax=Calothrix parasitica NIES-267 TaxID=1973488 RepID=A0A1Z4LNA4_9CYAN|nr:cadmium-translocating P-type ATPase [Calothrix parasitica NIES-267]